MTQNMLIEMVQRATGEVFATMLGIEAVKGVAYVDESAPRPSEGVLALVGLVGQWAGSGTFSCSATAAKKIAGQMLMQEYAAVDEEVLDAIGEVTNMVLGSVKTQLEQELGPMGLSIPTVIYGRNFTTRSVGRSEWIVVPFECLGERVEVHLCLVPSKETKLAQRQPAVLSMNDQ